MTTNTPETPPTNIGIDSGLPPSIAAGTGSTASANSGPLAAANDKPSTSSATPVGEKNSHDESNEADTKPKQTENLDAQVDGELPNAARAAEEKFLGGSNEADTKPKQTENLVPQAANKQSESSDPSNASAPTADKIQNHEDRICRLEAEMKRQGVSSSNEISKLKNENSVENQQISQLREETVQVRIELNNCLGKITILEKENQKYIKLHAEDEQASRSLRHAVCRWENRYYELQNDFSRLLRMYHNLRSKHTAPEEKCEMLQQKCDALESVLSDAFSFIISGKLLKTFNSTLEVLLINPADADDESMKRRDEYLKSHKHVADAIYKTIEKLKKLNGCDSVGTDAASLEFVGLYEPNFICGFLENYHKFMKIWPVVMQIVQNYREGGQQDIVSEMGAIDRSLRRTDLNSSSKNYLVLYEQELLRIQKQLEKSTKDYQEKCENLEETERNITTKIIETQKLEIKLSEEQSNLNDINRALEKKRDELKNLRLVEENLRTELRAIRLSISREVTNRIIDLDQVERRATAPVEQNLNQAQPQAAAAAAAAAVVNSLNEINDIFMETLQFDPTDD